MPTPKIALVVGTRPEAIKMAPVVLELRRESAWESILVSTGQHREMLAQALAPFGLKPDIDLDVMRHGQTLAQIDSKATEGLDDVWNSLQPSLILGQGDTTSCYVAAKTAFYRAIPFGHVEAGLRTDSIRNPFPEEFNRRSVALVAELHFAPTEWAKGNLLKERVEETTIFVTGNTGIDAVLQCSELAGSTSSYSGRVVLLTTHRRENWGEPQAQIARASRRLVEENPDITLVVAMHRNPQVRQVLESELGGHTRIHLIEPPDYADFVGLMKQATLILTDSGGVQEEAPAFGVPVLVLRETTERPEGVDAGTAKLVGVKEDEVFREANNLLTNPDALARMSTATSPYGDGHASERIRQAIASYFKDR